VRRALAITVTLGLLAAPLAVEAQPVGRMYRIGLLGASPPSAPPRRWDALLQGLRELGYVEGRNLTVEYRYSEGTGERLPDLAATLG
jgi:putative ABC transport system substrate-binding protein